MIEVPVSVDEVLDGIGANRCKRVADLRTCSGKPGVDKELTVPTREDSNISTGAHEDTYVAAELLEVYSSDCRCFSRRLHEPVILSEQMAWSQ